MWLCLSCSQEFSPEDPRIMDRSHPNYGGCPGCGARGIPADLEKRLSINITWHELRTLCIWAERWAGQSDDHERMMKIVYGIADRIQAQHLDQESGLTFRSELAELSQAGFTFKQNVIPEN